MMNRFNSSSQEIEFELDHNESVKSSSQEVECVLRFNINRDKFQSKNEFFIMHLSLAI
ncbi:10844_t:CDS:1, partial [Gigaspora rosea]